MVRSLTIVLAMAALLAGCSGLPGRGPAAISIASDDVAEQANDSYMLVDITPQIAETVGKLRSHDLGHRFGIPSASKTQRIGVGDQLSVRIWEAGPNGLFSSSTTGMTEIKSVVDESGTIFVPYVGRIRAAGSSIETVRIAIQEALADKAVQPQVQVAFDTNLTNSVVVLGDVANPGRQPITPNGTRVLDAVAQAGGSKSPSYETMVVLKRGNETGRGLIDDLFSVPSNNVFLKADDSIMLVNTPRSFTVFGAVEQVQLYRFDAPSVTLAEALAKAGGLDNMTADAGGVFLFRYEDSSVAKLIDPNSKLIVSGYQVPVVYRLNMNQPSAFFLARYFEMRDKDIVYIANHPLADFAKFLQLIKPALDASSRIVDSSIRWSKN